MVMTHLSLYNNNKKCYDNVWRIVPPDSVAYLRTDSMIPTGRKLGRHSTSARLSSCGRKDLQSRHETLVWVPGQRELLWVCLDCKSSAWAGLHWRTHTRSTHTQAIKQESTYESITTSCGKVTGTTESSLLFIWDPPGVLFHQLAVKMSWEATPSFLSAWTDVSKCIYHWQTSV